jgi:hypothetical protein
MLAVARGRVYRLVMLNTTKRAPRFLSPVARRLQLRRAWSDEMRRLAKLAGLYPKSVR